MKIIKANIDYLDDLTPLFNSYRIFYRQQSDLEGAKEFLFERFKNKDSIIFIAYKKQYAVGFTQLYHLFSSVSMEPMLLLNDLFTKESHRNQGIGEALINTAKEYCKTTAKKVF